MITALLAIFASLVNPGSIAAHAAVQPQPNSIVAYPALKPKPADEKGWHAAIGAR